MLSPLKEARLKADMKQYKLASLIGISQAELSNYELGRYRCPADKRHKLAKVLKKSVDELFPNEDDNI